MTDPFKSLLDLQRSAMDGWINSASQVMRYWQHLLELQERLINQATVVTRNHIEIDDGPTFTGKYGKRRFDIDPERDV